MGVTPWGSLSDLKKCQGSPFCHENYGSTLVFVKKFILRDRPTMNKREARVLEVRESVGGERTSAEGASLLPEAQRRN